MPRSSMAVTTIVTNTANLPDSLSPAAQCLIDLERRGWVEKLTDRVRIRRNGGYVGIDVLVVLLAYFTSAKKEGLKGFIQWASPFFGKLAALVGREGLPSQGSMSRALGNIDAALIRPQMSWLLRTVTEVQPLLRHPSVAYRDAMGERWFVVDFDGKLKAFRRRGLPAGDDYPEVVRATEGMAKAGYPGRKRGECQVMTFKSVHRGSQVCLCLRCSPGNGHRRDAIADAADHVVCAAEEAGYPRERAIFVADGAHGNVPDMTSLRAKGLAFVTRLTRPHLAQDPVVRQRLADAEWRRVDDSGSGPTRYATDLGVVRVIAAQSIKNETGEAYEAFDVRVVVSRYLPTPEWEATHHHTHRGFEIDGWRYELFAADLPEDAWPANDVVTLYFGRARQENGFHRENVEVNANRVLTYNLEGYELTLVAAHMVSNLCLSRGFELIPPPSSVPLPERREATSEPLSPPSLLDANDSNTEAAAERTTADELELVEAEVAPILASLSIDTVSLQKAGWTWDAPIGQLRCCDGHHAELMQIKPRGGNNARCFFRVPAAKCADCSMRSSCNTSLVTWKEKQKQCTVQTDCPDRLQALVRDARRLRKLKQHEENLKPHNRRVRGLGQPGRRRQRAELLPPQPTRPPGQWQTQTSRFLPAQARRIYRDAVANSRVYVHRTTSSQRPTGSTLVAPNRHAISKRRMTWQERNSVNALPDDVRVLVQLQPLACGEASITVKRWAQRLAS